MSTPLTAPGPGAAQDQVDAVLERGGGQVL
jgi:hypothetical protein